MGKLTITLTKSLIGRNRKHIGTARSLGLRKIGDTTVQEDAVTVQGKISQIGYLIKVENQE